MNDDPVRDLELDVDLEQQRLDRVVIAAAVAAVVGPRAAIRGIRAVAGKPENAWVREGRLAVQTSHSMAAPLIRFVR